MRTALWLVNVIGGIAVLGSYVWGVTGVPEPGRLWGRIPEGIRPVYSAFMPLAAIGYFLILAWAHRNPQWRMVAAMSVMLVCSTAWMPLSFAALENARLLPLVQAVLALTALASLAMGLIIWQGDPSSLRTAALVGVLAFCWQTVLLDALVWPRFFG